jgi:hypothetical protein
MMKCSDAVQELKGCEPTLIIPHSQPGPEMKQQESDNSLLAISATRGGHGGLDLQLTLDTSRSVSVIVIDSQSGQMRFLVCNGRWRGSLGSIGPGAGTVTASAERYWLSADYPSLASGRSL